MAASAPRPAPSSRLDTTSARADVPSTPSVTGTPSAPTKKPRRRFQPPRKLKFTREGKFFVGIAIGVGFAAVNTGNNLLYLLLGLLLALIVVSGVLSELSLRDLSVTRKLPPRAQVGKAHLVEIEVVNHKGKVPSYAIEVEDLRAGQPADKRCFFLKISPRSAQVAAYRRTPTRRGRDVHVAFRIATRFPFGLFEKSREVDASSELVIYPAVDPVRLAPTAGGVLSGTEATIARGHGDEHLGLRLLREGEDPRDVHWRKSAALGQLVMRERARDVHPDVTLRLDVDRPEGAGETWDTRFERRIRDLASRAVAHVKRGDVVVIVTSAGEKTRASRASGIDGALRFLALVKARDVAAATAGDPPAPATKPTKGAA